MTINFIQDIATPHNNILLKELNKDNEINLNIWYCFDKHPQYDWDNDLTYEVQKANIYQATKVDWKFIKYCIKHKDEKFFIVGWMNPSTKLLIVLFWILSRPLNIWLDYPNDESKRSRIKILFREMFYTILKTSNAKIFGVGKRTLEYFVNRGFSKDRLINLPIFVDTSKTKKDYISKKENIYKKYHIKETDLFLSAGSRLIYEKGYDILIEAINILDKDIKSNTKCVIVGKGEEKDRLLNRIRKYKLENNIFIEEWMEIEEFKALISNSDIFIHPARFDAYGGTIFAMALGTPVIGSLKAGAAFDRIIHHKNGLLYDGSIFKLNEKIMFTYKNKNLLIKYSEESILTANSWHPIVGKQIIKDGIK